MKIVIIEDERPASQKLIRLLKGADSGIEVIDVLGSVEQSVNWFSENQSPELIFMDIQLEDGLCFEIFEKIQIEAPVIFTTAYDEYALKAFKVNSIDYLLKPINPDELRNAINKFNTVHGTKQDYSKYESVIRQLPHQNKERFLIKIGEHYKSVLTSDVSCFYTLERSVFLFTCFGKSYPVDYSLDRIEQLVDSRLFFRVNRNFIVHYDAIQDMIIYSSNRIKIILTNRQEKEDILVSRERVSDFKRWMDR
ncbi:MAG: LytTR family DNA-binding domain-containing protein [Tannerellaceae bacterium]|jgi:DNA-binding LytR/AlgR family response regulator|nr:LytTR family DNA-binding domain-containing protein [Tannerellaceae bacterium]